jgi:hypothetical protein
VPAPVLDFSRSCGCDLLTEHARGTRYPLALGSGRNTLVRAVSAGWLVADTVHAWYDFARCEGDALSKGGLNAKGASRIASTHWFGRNAFFGNSVSLRRDAGPCRRDRRFSERDL